MVRLGLSGPRWDRRPAGPCPRGPAGRRSHQQSDWLNRSMNQGARRPGARPRLHGGAIGKCLVRRESGGRCHERKRAGLQPSLQALWPIQAGLMECKPYATGRSLTGNDHDSRSRRGDRLTGRRAGTRAVETETCRPPDRLPAPESPPAYTVRPESGSVKPVRAARNGVRNRPRPWRRPTPIGETEEALDVRERLGTPQHFDATLRVAVTNAGPGRRRRPDVGSDLPRPVKGSGRKPQGALTARRRVGAKSPVRPAISGTAAGWPRDPGPSGCRRCRTPG